MSNANSETTGWRREKSHDAYSKTIDGVLYWIARWRGGWYHRCTLISPQFYDYLADAKRAAHKHARERKA